MSRLQSPVADLILAGRSTLSTLRNNMIDSQGCNYKGANMWKKRKLISHDRSESGTEQWGWEGHDRSTRKENNKCL
jgi:hypothetical protein